MTGAGGRRVGGGARGAMMVRVVAVVAALLVCAFFALTIHQQDDTAAAAKRLADPDRPTAADARRTADLIDRADTLNPVATVDLLRARLALQTRRTGDARRILVDLVEREPANLDAWAVIAFAFKESDPTLFEAAVDAVARFNPPVPEP